MSQLPNLQLGANHELACASWEGPGSDTGESGTPSPTAKLGDGESVRF